MKSSHRSDSDTSVTFAVKTHTVIFCRKAKTNQHFYRENGKKQYFFANTVTKMPQSYSSFYELIRAVFTG